MIIKNNSFGAWIVIEQSDMKTLLGGGYLTVTGWPRFRLTSESIELLKSYLPERKQRKKEKLEAFEPSNFEKSLNPCPNCGGPAKYRHTEQWDVVVCLNCGYNKKGSIFKGTDPVPLWQEQTLNNIEVSPMSKEEIEKIIEMDNQTEEEEKEETE